MKAQETSLRLVITWNVFLISEISFVGNLLEEGRLGAIKVVTFKKLWILKFVKIQVYSNMI